MKITSEARLPGPNRRSEQPIIEVRLTFDDLKLEQDRKAGEDLLQAIRSRLQSLGCTGDFSPTPEGGGMPSPAMQLAQHFAQLALFLQQQAGHQVAEHGAVPDDEGPVWVWFEYDHSEVGQAAARMSLDLVRDVLGLEPVEPDKPRASSQSYSQFLEFARPRRLSAETRALLAAARRREIPCFNLDRYPYDPLEGPFRIRPGGLLRLGHARFQYVLDGSFCVNWNQGRLAALRGQPHLQAEIMACGIPVSISGQAQGERCRVLVIGGRPVAALNDSGPVDLADLLPIIGEQCEKFSRRWNVPVFAAEIAGINSDFNASRSAPAWLNVDLAPNLEKWCPANSDALHTAADLLLEQLYPPGKPCRIPIISITGTNGKTTTCTIAGHILQAAARTPVVVSSTGVWLAQKLQDKRHKFGPASTYYALEAADAQAAVFEDYFGSIVHFGFAFEWCDVAVCTNVTVDHLHHVGAHTLEQIAEIKFAPVRRARKAVVLNADNAYCAAMLPRATATHKLAVSMQQDRSSLAASHPTATHYCVLETEAGREVITLYEGETRYLLIATDEIPASFGGLVRHNVSNAMHAAAAAWMVGVLPATLSEALKTFVSDFDTCRGRLNEFQGLPYRAFIDYAHNADGFRLVSAFLDTQAVTGRKIILARFTSDRRKSELAEAVRELAGHFDHYVLTNYPRSHRKVATKNIPQLMQRALLEAGVNPSSIVILEDPQEAQDWVFRQAAPGDLLLLLLGTPEFEPVWQRLTDMRAALAD